MPFVTTSMTRLLLLAAAAVAALALPAPASADHDTSYQHGEKESPTFSAVMKNVQPPAFVNGPCTGEAARAMPAAAGHDHLAIGQHRFSCRASKVFFDPLTEVLADRPDIVLGEMDVKGNLMVVAVAFPESGFLLYDISNPVQPRLLSHYRGEECEAFLLDVDCGAYVDLSPDLRHVFISVQQITVLPNPSAAMRPAAAYPGVEVVDISDPTAPLLKQTLPVPSVGGVHTTRSFVVPEEGGDGPRDPGTYTVSVANSVGLAINEVLPTGQLAPVTMIEVAETHDTFIHEDPILNRTILYAAAGFDSGFYAWDITAPSAPVLLAEWDITPECGVDWYAHTIDVAVRNGRRIVTMPNELIDFFGEQGEDEDKGCGHFQGNGEFAGPMWFVDATDFSKLGPADTSGNGGLSDDEKAQLKAASEQTLITTWSNAAKRAGGELTFSPHNQQIVGDKVYLSQYHGGVVVLDASAAFAGRNVRPHEVALYVPHDEPMRPIHPDAGARTTLAGGNHFVTGFIDYRPLIWDMTYTNGHILIPDMTGGLTVVKEDDAPPPVQGPGVTPPLCTGDRAAPRSRITRVRLTRRGVRIAGRTTDRGCGVSRVNVAVARRVGRRCSFLSSRGRLERPRSCRRPAFLAARGTSRWSFSRRARLARGRYTVMVRATDVAANRERPRRRAIRRARVR